MSRCALFVIAFTVALGMADSVTAQNNRPGLEADIVTTFTLPRGTYSTSGRFFRSRDGKIREDSPLGATITDAKSDTVTILNHRAKEAAIITFHVRHRADRHAEPTFEPFDRITVDGHPVERSRGRERGQQDERWTATDIDVVVFAKASSSSFTMTREIRNIVLREPDPALFDVPDDYVVIRTRTAPEKSAADPVPDPRGK
jgi:hypothetical protein